MDKPPAPFSFSSCLMAHTPHIRKPVPVSDENEVLSRGEYQEILLARMAGGDLYANETRLKLRRVDKLLDRFREKPLYPKDK